MTSMRTMRKRERTRQQRTLQALRRRRAKAARQGRRVMTTMRTTPTCRREPSSAPRSRPTGFLLGQESPLRCSMTQLPQI